MAIGRSRGRDPCSIYRPRARFGQRRGHWWATPDSMMPIAEVIVRGRRLCITFCYADCMAQLVARLDDDLMAEVDRLVADGVVANRSEAVRLALERLVDQQQRQRVGAAIVDAYRRQPQTDAELAGLDEATRALVNEEPW
jgi:Arc/MetJ-type ribon-helix-helix transcriptional regulator